MAHSMRALWLLLLVGLVTGCPRKSGESPPPPDPAAKETPERVPSEPDQGKQSTIYLVDVPGRCLAPAEAEVPEGGIEDQVRAVVKALAAVEETETRLRCIPPGSSLRSVSVESGTAALDFNQVFAEPTFWAGSETELLRVYGLVNTVTELPGIRRVRLSVEGEPLESLGGHVELSEPLTRDESLIRGP